MQSSVDAAQRNAIAAGVARPSPADVAELVSMGFGGSQAADALCRCGGKLEDALQMLLEGPATEPLAPSGASGSLQSLISMGFATDAVQQALDRAAGDESAALQMLLSGELATTPTAPPSLSLPPPVGPPMGHA